MFKKHHRQDSLTEEEEKKVNEKFESFKNREYDEDEMNKVFEKEDKIMGKMKNRLLLGFVEDVKLFFCMLKDFFTKKYTEVPIGTIMAIVGTLLYVFTPVDVIPDFIIPFGYIDDAAILSMCLNFVKGDIDAYKKFLEENKGNEE